MKKKIYQKTQTRDDEVPKDQYPDLCGDDAGRRCDRNALFLPAGSIKR